MAIDSSSHAFGNQKSGLTSSDGLELGTGCFELYKLELKSVIGPGEGSLQRSNR